MVKLGIEYCFMEVSSHAISQNRIYGLTYAIAAAFTNLSHDHLDYHKTFQSLQRCEKRNFLIRYQNQPFLLQMLMIKTDLI